MNTPARPPQYFAAFSACMGAVAAGSVLGYSSPASYQFRGNFFPENEQIKSPLSEMPSFPLPLSAIKSVYESPEEVIPETIDAGGIGGITGINITDLTNKTALIPLSHNLHLTLYQLQWFSSLYAIGALLGGLVTYPMLQSWGRKRTIMASAAPAILGWILIGTADSFSMLVAGRIFTGTLLGINGAAVNTYVGEFASPDVRGYLGSGYHVMCSAGILYGYMMGMYLPWYNLAFVCLVPTLLCLFLMSFVPESPAFLLMKGRDEEAAAALQRFRGKHYDISFEFDELKLIASTTFTKISLSEFKLPSVYKPLTIVIVLIVFKLLSGINTVNVNMAYIFKLSKSPVPEHIGSIICALVELISAVLSGLIMETAGRKKLLLASAFGMALTHTLLGTYFDILQTQEAVAHAYLAWLPLSCILVYSFMFSVGFGTIPFILIGELLPPAIKEQASSLAMAVHWSTAFVTVFAFDPLQDILNPYGFYWLLAGCCVAAIVFTASCFQETKGKTLLEISNMYRVRALVCPHSTVSDGA